MVQENRRQVENAIGVCYRLYQETKNTQWADQAFLFAEHNKSFVLNESVKRNIAASLFMQNDSIYNRIQELNTPCSNGLSIKQTKIFFIAGFRYCSKITGRQAAAGRKPLLQNESAVKIKNPQYTSWLSHEADLTAEEMINSVHFGKHEHARILCRRLNQLSFQCIKR